MKRSSLISGFAALALALAFTAAPAHAQQKLVPAQSEIAFTSKQMGVPVDGKFRKFDAQVAKPLMRELRFMGEALPCWATCATAGRRGR